MVFLEINKKLLAVPSKNKFKVLFTFFSVKFYFKHLTALFYFLFYFILSSEFFLISDFPVESLVNVKNMKISCNLILAAGWRP